MQLCAIDCDEITLINSTEHTFLQGCPYTRCQQYKRVCRNVQLTDVQRPCSTTLQQGRTPLFAHLGCFSEVCVRVCVRERHRMVPISADDFPREPAEQSYRARVSSAGTVCTVLNNVPKTREVVKENSLLQFNNIEKEWMESCIINPVLQKWSCYVNMLFFNSVVCSLGVCACIYTFYSSIYTTGVWHNEVWWLSYSKSRACICTHVRLCLWERVWVRGVYI